MNAFVQALGEYIARFEGFYKAGSRAARNNNPGNIRIWGNLPRDAGGYAVFPTVEAGWSALYRQIELDSSRGLTLRQFISKYAPPSDNNPTGSYLAFLARKLGIGEDVQLSAAAGSYSPPLPPAAGARSGALAGGGKRSGSA